MILSLREKRDENKKKIQIEEDKSKKVRASRRMLLLAFRRKTEETRRKLKDPLAVTRWLFLSRGKKKKGWRRTRGGKRIHYSYGIP